MIGILKLKNSKLIIQNVELQEFLVTHTEHNIY